MPDGQAAKSTATPAQAARHLEDLRREDEDDERVQDELEDGDQGRQLPARLEAVAAERDAHGDEGAGDGGGAEQLDHLPERAGTEAGDRPQAEPTRMPTMIGWVSSRAAGSAGATPGGPRRAGSRAVIVTGRCTAMRRKSGTAPSSP